MNLQDKKIEKHLKSLSNLFNTSQYDLLISKCKKIIKEFPEYVVLYNILGSAYQNIGKAGYAKEIFKKGIKMDPNNISIMNNLANTLKQMGEADNAENLYQKIIDKNPNYINAYINYGNLKRDSNNFKAAIELYNKALKLNDKLPIIYYSLSLAYQGIGDFNLAIDFANKTLAIEPKFTQADMMISQITKYTEKNKHFDQMKIKEDKLVLNENQSVNLSFALAKAYEDMNRIEESFNYLEKGNKIKRKNLQFNIDQEIKLFTSIKENFKKINFSEFKEKHNLKKNIIFILGMPRSGTTLVEQIISSHPHVFGSGELPYLSKIIKDELMENNELSTKKIENLMKDKLLVNNLREQYYTYLEKFNANEDYLTDKAPLNFRWIGLIKILFPNAKIIHCSRNSKDNCLSLYKNLFEGGLNFSYDQKELGTYYNLYSDLMNFWKNLSTNLFFEAAYENIVNNQEVESKKIIEFCGLVWDPKCLSFYKNKSPIKTMSTAQARQPIYKSSVKSYEKFESFLKTLNTII